MDVKSGVESARIHFFLSSRGIFVAHFGVRCLLRHAPSTHIHTKCTKFSCSCLILKHLRRGGPNGCLCILMEPPRLKAPYKFSLAIMSVFWLPSPCIHGVIPLLCAPIPTTWFLQPCRQGHNHGVLDAQVCNDHSVAWFLMHVRCQEEAVKYGAQKGNNWISEILQYQAMRTPWRNEVLQGLELMLLVRLFLSREIK